MSLCQSIDTLSMAYLDDELVSEERRELELHLLSCATCKHHVESERAEIALVRRALAPPPAPPALKVSIQRLLDAEDRSASLAARRRWTRFALPVGASFAAAAAILVFVFARPVVQGSSEGAGRVAEEAMRQQRRAMPLEVEGPGTGRWLRQHFAAGVEPAQFPAAGVELLGARLTAISGHDAAMLKYGVTMGPNRFTLTGFVIDDPRGDDLMRGQPVKLGDRMLYVHKERDLAVVTYVDASGPDGARIGYAFASERLSMDELLELVVSTDLIGRASQGR